MFLECVFMSFPGLLDRSEFTSDYLLGLTSVICSGVCPPCVASMIVHFTHAIPISLQGINCLMF